MDRYICIHGHFYQPPRENPWLEAVELQDSAYPYHDWNTKITAECYAPNTSSRILDSQKQIIDIVNNYAKISFNFGPTLLSWLKKNNTQTYQAILEADQLSQQKFSGHGSALAQAYNHMIMPLASLRDKHTQVIWGLKDFEYRFKRPAEGMWLPETAVDLETLDVLAEYGIKFTILAPNQAQRVKELNEQKWTNITPATLDTKQAYLCRLPSGKTINIFFYDGSNSHAVAFNNLLNSGEDFAKKLAHAFADQNRAQLEHIATDGESYGHHHRFGDMALAYCLHYLEAKKLARITVYGEFLEKHPPTQEVEIFEKTSWSCAHGVKRWSDNCGCCSGANPNWNQNWRAPLKEAMDWLKDSLDKIYEEQALDLFYDPWQARNSYINVILDRSLENIDKFFQEQAKIELNPNQKVKALKLLEMQRHGMLMYTSCGWFFDEISGIETIQIIQYAARSFQLAKETSGIDLEPAYLRLLEKAPSNLSKYKNGAIIFEKLVKPTMIDLLRVGAHYAVSSLFEDYPETINIYCYLASKKMYDRIDLGRQTLAVGKVKLHSKITLEEDVISFGILHLGDHNLIGGAHRYSDVNNLADIQAQIKDSFQKSDSTQVIFLVDQYFGSHSYSLWHLFKDEQRKVLDQIVTSTLNEIGASFRQIFENNYPIMQVMHEMHIPLPRALKTVVEFTINNDLAMLLQQPELNLEKLQKVAQEFKKWETNLDQTTLGFMAQNKLDSLLNEYTTKVFDLKLLKQINAWFNLLKKMQLRVDLWNSQNIYFKIASKHYQEQEDRARQGDDQAKSWLEEFDHLGNFLTVLSP
ncbi:MAG: DUF3536 domain-containing protein [Pseudomonadota bacterium]